MADEVVLNKAAVMERCLKRITEEYVTNEAELESDYTRQDTIVLNLLRASEAAIDLAMAHAKRSLASRSLSQIELSYLRGIETSMA